MEKYPISEEVYKIISYTLMIGTAAFTSWYPGHLLRKAEGAA